MFHRSLRSVAVCALVTLGLAGSALADKKADKEARALYAEGTRAYEKGDYKNAVVHYGRAYSVLPNALFLYNIAQAYRLDGQREQSLRYYKMFLDKQPDAKNRIEVEARISALEQELAAAATAPGPSPSPEPSPSPSPVASPEPSPSPAVPSPAVTAEALPLGPAPSGQPAHDRGKPIYKKWWFWAGVGAVAVGATVATILLTAPDDASPPPSDTGNTRIFTLGAW